MKKDFSFNSDDLKRMSELQEFLDKKKLLHVPFLRTLSKLALLTFLRERHSNNMKFALDSINDEYFFNLYLSRACEDTAIIKFIEENF